MKVAILTILLCAVCAGITLSARAGGKDGQPVIYGFKVAGLEGGTIDFSQFKGKKILIVNTASECGYTPQYEGLEALYKANKGKMVIVGFPSNDFGAQEPGDNKTIASFCKKNYGVSFPMASKVVVKGDKQVPLYRWLTHKSENGFQDSEVKWNFNKYLIDEQGHLIGVYPSSVTPQSAELKAAIEK
ncbi:MAG: glutathione peroxidase [Chitinophagaceae bacterium]